MEYQPEFIKTVKQKTKRKFYWRLSRKCSAKNYFSGEFIKMKIKRQNISRNTVRFRIGRFMCISKKKLHM